MLTHKDTPNLIEYSTIRIDEWHQFFSVLPFFTYHKWVFRGQEDASWGLKTGLEREFGSQKSNSELRSTSFDERFDFWTYERVQPKTHHQERNAIAAFMSYERSKFPSPHPYIDALVDMQHYGSKTRLLDFTWSMLVALFFAFEKQANGKQRALFAINYESIVTDSRSIAAFKDSKISSFGFGPDDADHCEKTALEELFGDRKKTVESLLEIAERNITEDSFERRDVFPVLAEGNNPRISAQNGLFLMSASFDPFEDNLARTFGFEKSLLAEEKTIRGDDTQMVIQAIQSGKFIKFVFDEKLERQAWNILDHANVSSQTMYPDRVGLARSIRYDN